MKKFLVVNSKSLWIDRDEIKEGDVIVALSEDGVKHVCASLGLENSHNRWQIVNPLTGHIHAYAPFFTSFFCGDNKDLVKGWKFYKLED